MGILKDSKAAYRLTGKTTEADVLAAAEGILKGKLERLGSLGNPRDATDFLRMRLGTLLHEEFHILWLAFSGQPQPGGPLAGCRTRLSANAHAVAVPCEKSTWAVGSAVGGQLEGAGQAK